MKIHDDVSKLDFGRNFSKEESLRETDDINQYFVKQMLTYWENNLTNIFRRKKDINVANAVLELFRRRENIENFNKKALYILIREMTDSNTQHITRVVNVMKKYHERLYNEYLSEGDIDTSNTGSIF
jgi:hypothetical protein